MLVHRPDVVDLVKLLAFMVKDCDPDQMELYYLGSDVKARSKSEQAFANSILGTKFRGTTDLTTRLGEILSDYGREIDNAVRPRTFNLPRRPPKKKSIYILTDGKLETGEETQGHFHVRTIINKLSGAGFDREQLGIQFIRFGNDSNGKRRLDVLDELARNEALPL